MSQLEDRYIVLKRSDLNDYQAEVINEFITSQHIKQRAGAVIEADWPIYPAAERMILNLAADPEGTAMLHEIGQPEISVAAVSVQVIGELNRMLLSGWAHDDKSVKMVMGTVAWLTSVLDGKAANPTYIGEGFVNACTALDQSMLDEVDRCQHFLNSAVEEGKKAESRALVNELYASWYIKLREDQTLAVHVVDDKGDEVSGADLDVVMEDHDEDLNRSDLALEDPDFGSFDDDVDPF